MKEKPERTLTTGEKDECQAIKRRGSEEIRDLGARRRAAVQAVFDSLRESKHARMIFRRVDERDIPIEQRRTIYLCG
jgi:hypothetical protein